MKKKLKKICKKIIACFDNINHYFDHLFKETKLKYIFQFFPNNIFLLIFFIYSLFIYVPQITANDTHIKNVKEITGFSEKIVDKPIEQNINVKNIKYIDKVGLLVGTYRKQNDSTYIFKLYENDKNIVTKTIDAKNMPDVQYYYIKFKRIKIDENKTYKFKFIPKNVNEENAISLGINENVEKDNVDFVVSFQSEFKNIILIVFIVFLLIFLLINFLINNKKINNDNILLIFLFYGLSFLFILPPTVEPDGTYHFYTSYRLSQYNYSKTTYQNQNKKILLPNNIICIDNCVAKGNNFISINELTSCFESQGKTYRKDSHKTGSRYISYIPSALGIKFISLFTSSPLLIYYFSKLINFAVLYLILLFAYKQVPKYKNVFILIAFIPMFLQQFVSLSYDGLLNTLCILVVSYLIKFYNTEKEISKKDLIIYFISSYIIYIIKKPYIIISMLIILIDFKKFGKEQKNKWIKLLTMFALICIIGEIRSIYISYGTVNTISESKPSNFKFLLNHPKHIIKVIYNTFLLKTDFYIQSLIGFFGAFIFKLDQVTINSYILVLILVTLCNSSLMKKSEKIINFSFLLVIFIGIFAALYFGWSSYMLDYVEGVQGRYFIPLLFPLIVGLTPKKKIIDLSNDFIYTYINIVMIITMATLMVGFY